MRTIRQAPMKRLSCGVFLFGMVTLASLLVTGAIQKAYAQQGPPVNIGGLPLPTEAEMTAQHEMIKEDLANVETNLDGTIKSESTTIQGEIGAQHAITQGDIADALAALQTTLATLQGTVDTLSGGENNHTLRWDKTYDSTNGDDNPTPGCNSDRFKCIFGGDAVLDRNTGLVWEKIPDATLYSLDVFDNPNGRRACLLRGTGGQMGWRLPSIHELGTLMVPGGGLPADHPFTLTDDDGVITYWSMTRDNELNNPNAFQVQHPKKFWVAQFDDGNIFSGGQNFDHPAWCVRSGAGLPLY